MVTTDQRLEMIDAIKQLPAAIHHAVHGLDEIQLDTPYREGGWTIRQVVHHIADSHMNAYIRMKLILTEDHPTLKPYDQDQWAELADGCESPVDYSLAILRGLHCRWSIMLEDLPDFVWSRSAYHPENGEMTLDDLLRTYAHHGVHHVEQILRLREQKGW